MPNLQAFTVKSTGFLQVHDSWKLLQYFIDFWISGERSNFSFLDWLPRRCPSVRLGTIPCTILRYWVFPGFRFYLVCTEQFLWFSSLTRSIIWKLLYIVFIIFCKICYDYILRYIIYTHVDQPCLLGFPAGLPRPGKSREGPGTGRDRTGPRNPEGPMVPWSRD
jgi:hypothetical protein